MIHFLDGGRTAVAFFFVLSGFVLTYQYPSVLGSAERRSFWVNRVARIYPLLIFALLLSAPAVTFAYINRRDGYLLNWYSLDSHAILGLSVSFAAQVGGLIGWLPVASFNQPWNGAAWSISCEFFFYAIFPWLTMWLGRRSNKGLCFVGLSGFVAQGAVLVLIANVAPLGQRGFLLAQFPIVHTFDFIAGIIAALVFSRPGVRQALQVRSRRYTLLAGAIAPLAAISGLQPINPVYYLTVPFFAVLILGMAVAPSRGILGSRPAVLLGASSYALYIMHTPIIRGSQALHMPDRLGWPLLAVCVATSIVLHKQIENPCRRWIKTNVEARHRQVTLPEQRVELVAEGARHRSEAAGI